MKKICVYTSDNCAYCAAVKEFLLDKNLEFEVFNISSDKQKKRELMQKGILSVPATMIDEEVVIGFDKEKLENALKN